MLKLHRKGQSLVEFGIVLPIFIGLMVFIFGLTVYCYNIIALSTMSRDTARQLIMYNSSTVGDQMQSIVDHYNSSTGTKPILYEWDGAIHLPSDWKTKEYITVNMTATNKLDLTIPFLPKEITVGTTMYWENKNSN